MNLKRLSWLMMLAAPAVHAAMGTTEIPTFAGQAAAAEAAKNAMPTTPETWLARMTDFQRNASAFKDPKVFVPWANTISEPAFYIAALNGMMDPGSWLNMMNSAAHPDALRNLVQFADPAIYLRWSNASLDPNFYGALATQLGDPNKLMRWAAVPADPRLWNVFFNAFNPNTYIRWGMAPLDPRAWNLAGTMANPALYTSMAGALVNPSSYGPGSNAWLSWKPAPAIQGAGSFAMWDPVAMLGNLSGFLPSFNGVSLPALPGMAPVAAPAPAAKAAEKPAVEAKPELVVEPAVKAAAPAKVEPAPAKVEAAPAQPAPVAAPVPNAYLPAPAPAAPVEATSNKVVLAGDALFKSGKSGIRDLSPAGKAKLDEVVSKLKGVGEIDQIRVVGHADPTGDATANLKLSAARAKSVKSYLVAKGIKPNVIITSGVGDAQPVVQCAPDLTREKLKECHAPNRRVEIEIVAKGQ